MKNTKHDIPDMAFSIRYVKMSTECLIIGGCQFGHWFGNISPGTSEKQKNARIKKLPRKKSSYTAKPKQRQNKIRAINA